jgi:hypothetical protein
MSFEDLSLSAADSDAAKTIKRMNGRNLDFI